MLQNKLIVFDWNGTLISDTRQSWIAGNACLEFYGSSPLSLKEYREYFTFPIIHFYKKVGLSVDEVLAKKEEANEVFQKSYDKLAANARTRSGARKTLNWLQTQKATSIILSNYLTEKIHTHTKRLKIDGFFDDISAHTCNGTTILEKTSKVERLKDYMDSHGFTPDNTIIIGDSAEEPEIARLLGLISVGISDGYISHTRLKHAAPDYIIHRLDEIIPLLKRCWQD